MPGSSKTYVSMKEFMDLAIGFETESADYYRDMAAMVSDDETRDLLQKLEGQEREHERVLKAFTAPSDDEIVLQFAPDLSLSMPEPPQDPEYTQMLTVAIERERKSAEIYTAASSRTTGEFADMVLGLAAFEKEHEDRLSRLLANSAS